MFIINICSERLAILNWRELLMIKILRLVKILRVNKILSFKGQSFPFVDYFKGFEKLKVVRQIFGERTEDVLRNLKIEFTRLGGYMWVNSMNGHLMVNPYYINNGDRVDIYLDIIHELVHVSQLMDGKSLFDANYSYVDRPTEVEAYKYAVQEAKKLGLSFERICEYLKTEWISDEELNRLVKKLNLKCGSENLIKKFHASPT